MRDGKPVFALRQPFQCTFVRAFITRHSPIVEPQWPRRNDASRLRNPTQKPEKFTWRPMLMLEHTLRDGAESTSLTSRPTATKIVRGFGLLASLGSHVTCSALNSAFKAAVVGPLAMLVVRQLRRAETQATREPNGTSATEAMSHA